MISFVVLHYQALEETKACIDNIKKHIYSEKRIVIVDNYSPNGSGKKLADYYKEDFEVEVLLLKSNLGFAQGNNRGYKFAKKFNPDFIVVMNNDLMLVEDDTEDKIIRGYEETGFDIMGPDIYSTRDNYHQNPQRIKNYTLEELQNYSQKTRFKLAHKWLIKVKYALPFSTNKTKHSSVFIQETVENCVLHGACYVYSKKYIQSHDNCFYDKTFMYFESYILQYLGEREGLKTIYYPYLKVEHHEDVATDLTYTNRYKKSVFTNQCLLDSCNTFINVMNNKEIRIG